MGSCQTQSIVPAAFATKIVDLHGPRGRDWLGRLPLIVRELESLWGVAVGPALEGLSYNFVASARTVDGAEAILKLALPGMEPRKEEAALRAYAGGPCVKLLESDQERGALLLERLSPGRQLQDADKPGSKDDEDDTRIAARLMRELWIPPPEGHIFPSVEDWAEGLERYEHMQGPHGPIPLALIDEAQGLYLELLSSASPPMLLHGDLHHFNILSDGDGWRMIDPQGVIGEPAYEAGALLRNPWPAMVTWPDAREVSHRRLDIFAEEWGIDRERIRLWSLAQAVLSACWTVEDGEGDGAHSLACAELMRGA